MPDKKRILFVDDESNILSGLRRMLRSMRRQWEMKFALSGPDALEQLAQYPFDVVVTDMRMPGMNGAQLLKEVMARYPKPVRIVLSGQAEREAILGAVGPIHQYLSKPCAAETLKTTLIRACNLDYRLADEDLKRYISQMETLPSLPSVYDKVVNELQSPETSAQDLGHLISQDMGMSAKVLQLVNSAFFGLRPHVPHPTEAVILLGLDTLKLLGLSTQVFSEFAPLDVEGLSLNGFWNHSVAVGKLAQKIAQVENVEQREIDYAYTAGLLHDVGKLVLAMHNPKKYTGAIELASTQNLALTEAEGNIFKTATHAEAGAYLMDLWGLPEPIVETLMYHHQPEKYPDQKFSCVTAVHVADALVSQLSPAHKTGASPLINQTYLAKLGLTGHLPKWKKLCAEAVDEDAK